MLRITNQQLLQFQQLHQTRHSAAAARLQQQVSSGERLHRPSDDPSAQAMILGQQSTIDRLDARIGSIESLRAQLNHSYQSVLDAQQVLTQAKSLAIEGRQETDPDAIEVIAKEVDGLLGQLQAIANRSHDGAALFGGTNLSSEPFVFDATGRLAEYRGSDVNGLAPLTGEPPVLQHRSGVDVFAPAELAGGIGDAFDLLATLRDDLRNAAGVPGDVRDAALGQRLDDLDAMSGHLLEVVGEESVTLRGLDAVQERSEQLLLDARTRLGELQDVDYATALVELQATQLQQQLSLATAVRMFDVSILNFLS
ncbi:MAG: hypothetical protein R3B90_03330 [Planctomycetaceae bacterium]